MPVINTGQDTDEHSFAHGATAALFTDK